MLSHCTLIQLNLLAHEFRYHPVERASLKVQYLPRPTDPFLPGAEATEILGGEGHDVGSEFNLNPSLGLSSDGHVKEDDGVSSGHGLRAAACVSPLTLVGRYDSTYVNPFVRLTY